ncbi:MAG: ABC transporter ATP-binding protein [Elusimicrobia bacterium GWA2_61_42]|nr:MAG: ABC transporter ATP-binding protein [Elusimicrobia bacterium GWA2_61_42]OGR75128.1 MAG: ABC transporter ATP-binding protein [Elusimicrobia bacterium GWC2_61_25]
MPAIKIQNLVKRYSEVTAVDGVSLEIPDGEVFGLLGPNGAGKTTLISMLATLVKPTSGTALVAGRDIRTESLEVRRNIGIVFQEPSVDDLLTGRENLYLHSMLYGVPRREIRPKIETMLGLVNLADRADSLVKTYSGGMRRRLEIARGLIHGPKILFLDEPTLGLDPASRKAVWTHIRELKETHNTTIILTTHYMEEADSLADRIAIINKGKIIELDTPAALKKKVGQDLVFLKGDINEAAVRALPFVDSVQRGDGRFTISMENAGANLQALLNAGGRIEEVEVRRVTLDDVFLKFAGQQISEDAEEHSESIFERIAVNKTQGK